MHNEIQSLGLLIKPLQEGLVSEIMRISFVLFALSYSSPRLQQGARNTRFSHLMLLPLFNSNQASTRSTVPRAPLGRRQTPIIRPSERCLFFSLLLTWHLVCFLFPQISMSVRLQPTTVTDRLPAPTPPAASSAAVVQVGSATASNAQVRLTASRAEINAATEWDHWQSIYNLLYIKNWNFYHALPVIKKCL